MNFRSSSAALLLILASVIVCDLGGCVSDRQTATTESVQSVLSTTTLLATIPEADQLNGAGLAGEGHGGGKTFVIHEKGKGFAFVGERNGVTYVNHNGKEQNPYQGIDHLTLSPDGQRVAYSYRIGKRSMVVDGIAGRFFDDVWEPVFSPDNRHVAYIAQLENVSYIVLDNQLSNGASSFTGPPVFSADSSKIAYVESAWQGRNARLIVSDLHLKPLLTKECTNGDLLTTADKSRIVAVSVVDGKQSIIVIDFGKPAVVMEGPPYDAVLKVGFGSDGNSVAYAAQKGKERFLVYNGKEQRLPDDAEIESLVIHPGRKGVGIIMASGGQYVFRESFLPTPRKGVSYDEATGLVYNRDGSMYAYIAARGKNVFMVANGNEGPMYDFIAKPPIFSPDGKELVYRARKNGRRFVVVADTSGRVIRQHPEYEQVFPPVFTTDGKSVAYGVKDGQMLWWKVEKL